MFYFIWKWRRRVFPQPSTALRKTGFDFAIVIICDILHDLDGAFTRKNCFLYSQIDVRENGVGLDELRGRGAR